MPIMETPFFKPFDKLPFINTSDAYERTLCSLWFYAESEWQLWLQMQDGNYFMPKGAWPGECFYWGDKAADPSDISFDFWDFLAQRGNIMGIRQQIIALQDDFLNLSASVAKIDFLFLGRANPEFKAGLWRMVATEIEYIISVFRVIRLVVVAMTIPPRRVVGIQKRSRTRICIVVQRDGRGDRVLRWVTDATSLYIQKP